MASLDGVDELARAIGESVSWVVSASSAWWLETPTGGLGDTQIAQLRNLLLPLAVVLATAGLMWQGIRMIMTRHSGPLMDIGRGLWSIAVWGAIGTVAPLVALRAGDEFSMWVLSEATGAVGADVRLRLISAFSLAGIPAQGAVIILGIIVMISVFLQALLMLLRELAVLLIAVLLQTAAASSLARPGNGGVARMLGWSAALIAYKPVVALIYAIAFLIIGAGPDPSARPFFVGTAALLLSLVAFPATLRFFQRSVRMLEDGWRPRQVTAARLDARALGAMSGSGGPAGAHARYLAQSLCMPPPPGPASVLSAQMSVNPLLPDRFSERNTHRADILASQVLGAATKPPAKQGSEQSPEPDSEREPRE